MLDIFSTREIAFGVWLFIFIIIILIPKKMRHAAKRVVKAACAPKLAIPFFVFIIYGIAVTFIFSKLPIWDCKFIKDILIWVTFVGIPTCYKGFDRDFKKGYFKSVILDNLKFIVIVEFLLSTFTFHLIVELLLVPALTFIYLLEAIAGIKEEFGPAKTLLSWILSISCFVIVAFTIERGINDYIVFESIDTYISLFLPLILSVLYLPIVYVFSLYAKYGTAFTYMSIRESGDKKTQRKHKWKVFKACNVFYSRITKFGNEGTKRMCVKMTEDEFDENLKLTIK